MKKASFKINSEDCATIIFFNIFSFLLGAFLGGPCLSRDRGNTQCFLNLFPDKRIEKFLVLKRKDKNKKCFKNRVVPSLHA